MLGHILTLDVAWWLFTMWHGDCLQCGMVTVLQCGMVILGAFFILARYMVSNWLLIFPLPCFPKLLFYLF